MVKNRRPMIVISTILLVVSLIPFLEIRMRTNEDPIQYSVQVFSIISILLSKGVIHSIVAILYLLISLVVIVMPFFKRSNIETLLLVFKIAFGLQIVYFTVILFYTGCVLTQTISGWF